MSGAVVSVTGGVSHILTPLSQGLGNGVSGIGQGIGSGANAIGEGTGDFMEFMPLVGGIAVVGFLLLESSDRKRGGEGYLGPMAKRFRSG